MDGLPVCSVTTRDIRKIFVIANPQFGAQAHHAAPFPHDEIWAPSSRGLDHRGSELRGVERADQIASKRLSVWCAFN